MVAENVDLVLSRDFYNGTEDPMDIIEIGAAVQSLYWHSHGDLLITLFSVTSWPGP